MKLSRIMTRMRKIKTTIRAEAENRHRGWNSVSGFENPGARADHERLSSDCLRALTNHISPLACWRTGARRECSWVRCCQSWGPCCRGGPAAAASRGKRCPPGSGGIPANQLINPCVQLPPPPPAPTSHRQRLFIDDLTANQTGGFYCRYHIANVFYSRFQKTKNKLSFVFITDPWFFCTRLST